MSVSLIVSMCVWPGNCLLAASGAPINLCRVDQIGVAR